MKAAEGINWLAWWQLLRAANVFTAASNLIAVFLLVQRDWQPLGILLLLVLASVLLYEAGMVLNDVCDAELDAVERPERPIPSGRVSKRNALWVGIALLVGGVFTAYIVTLLTHQWQTTQIAFLLATTIVGYNVGVNSTRLGPLAMGGCRMMNVLLGATVGANLSTLSDHPEVWLFAIGIGVYTAGLTLIARREAETSNQSELSIGAALVNIGVIGIILLPTLLERIAIPFSVWIAISCLLPLVTGILCYRLLANPTQLVTRASVGRLIRLFIVIDAAVCALAAGLIAGTVVFCFLFPMKIISRRTPMT